MIRCVHVAGKARLDYDFFRVRKVVGRRLVPGLFCGAEGGLVISRFIKFAAMMLRAPERGLTARLQLLPQLAQKEPQFLDHRPVRILLLGVVLR